MRKDSYVNTRDIHLTPLVLLEKYARHEVVYSHCLTPESLEIVRLACGLASVHKRGRQLALADASYNLDQTVPEAISRWPVYLRAEEIPARRTFDNAPRSYRQLVSEQQALLRDVPATNIPQNFYQVYTPELRLPQSQQHAEAELIRSLERLQVPDVTFRSMFLWFLTACFLLYMSVMLVGFLCYEAFLGITWMIYAFISLLATVGANILAFGHYIAHGGAVIARPIIVVCKGLVDVVERTVVPLFQGLFQGLVRWTQEILNGHV